MENTADAFADCMAGAAHTQSPGQLDDNRVVEPEAHMDFVDNLADIAGTQVEADNMVGLADKQTDQLNIVEGEKAVAAKRLSEVTLDVTVRGPLGSLGSAVL